ncbi:uncharacterized protein LOC124295132 isoform X1 [Neodiprion lecontei]|uniref:Uncharacterized protein LOC124295132 isoform X1 n=1 Tax=Neodiprion lecontei TaxID=441921 RepID=A0ABM3GI88_NEOLC|nr:uncharacterized protein LOC124295132 isoform X1 [Neodiprion lecontei]
MGSSPEKCCCQSPHSASASATYNQERQTHPTYDPTTRNQQPPLPRNQNQPCHSFTPYNPPCPSRLYPEPKKSTFGSTLFTGLIILSIFAFLYYYYTYVLPRTGFRNLTRSPFYEGHNPTSFHLTRSTMGYASADEVGESDEPDDIHENDSAEFVALQSSGRGRQPSLQGIRRDVKPGQSTEPYLRCTRVSIDSSSRRQDSSDNLSGHGGRSKSCLDGVPRLKTRNAGI